WLRMAVLAILTGEISGGGGVNFPSDFNWPQPPNQPGARELLPSVPDWNAVMQALPWLLALAFIASILVLIFLYIHSVMRFVLFDSVVTGECSLRRGWTRWRTGGMQYFIWLMAFHFVVLTGLLLLVGLPVFLAWQQGVFPAPKAHVPLLIAGGLVLFLVLIVFGLLIAAVNALAKDFVVPIMALEDVSAFEGWRLLLRRIDASKGSYAGYLGMKLLLAIALGIAMAMVNVIIILIVLIPAGVAIFLLVAMKEGAAILLAILLGILAFILLLALLAIVGVPVAVFFQAYAIYFFGARYDRLADLLWPPPPPAPQAPEISPAPA